MIIIHLLLFAFYDEDDKTNIFFPFRKQASATFPFLTPTQVSSSLWRLWLHFMVMCQTKGPGNARKELVSVTA